MHERLSRVRTLLVDLDGTLLGQRTWRVSLAFIRAVMRELAPRTGYTRAVRVLSRVKDSIEAPPSEVRENRSILARTYETYARELGISYEEAEKAYPLLMSKVFSGLKEYFWPLKGSREFLEWAKTRFRLVLASNPTWPREITELRVKWAGIDPAIFEWITLAAEFKVTKPHIEYYGHILKHLELDGPECLLIGNDREMDLPATKLGIPVALIRRTAEPRELEAKEIPGTAPAWRLDFDQLKNLLTSLALIFFASNAYAQTSEAPLEFTVQAEKFRDRKTLSLSERTQTSASQKLDLNPDVQSVKVGGASGEQSLWVWGLGGRYSQVLLENQPWSDPMSLSGADLSNLHPEELRSIEILPGPHSAQYGPGASSGVARVLHEPRSGVRGGGEASSEFSAREWIWAESSNFALGAMRLDAQGISAAASGTEKDPAARTLVLGKAWLGNPDRASGFKVGLRYSEMDLALDQSLPGIGVTDDLSAWSRSRTWGATFDSRLNISKQWALHLRESSMLSRYMMGSALGTYDREGQVHRLGLAAQNGLKEHGQITLGIDRGFSQGLTADGLWIARTLEPYAVYENAPEIDQCGNKNCWQIRTAARSTESAQLEAQVGWFRKHFPVGWRLQAGRWSRMPSLYERFSPYGDPYLRAENGTTWALSLLQPPLRWSRSNWELTYFDHALFDSIQFSSGSYRNLGRVSSRGLELKAKQTVPGEVLLTGSYRLAHARDETARIDLEKIPRHEIGLRAEREWAHTGVWIQGRYVSERPDSDAVARQVLPAYFKLDLGATLKFPGAELFARIENVLNADTQDVLGYGAPGRTVFVGAQVEI